MANEEPFFHNYFVLEPKQASLFDLIRMLYTEKGRFVSRRQGADGPDRLSSVRGRWLAFLSLLLQKIFLWFRSPMAWLGSELETWLNLLSCNCGFVSLVMNLLKGKVKKPDRSSATFRSLVGNLDNRVALDKSIRNDDSRRYNPLLSIMAAKLAYENKAFVETVITKQWKMKFLESYAFWNEYQQRHSTNAIMFQDTTSDPDLIVVAFRGTEPFNTDDWSTDVDISWYERKNVGKIHGGFIKALGLQKSGCWPKEDVQYSETFAYYTIRERLKKLLSMNDKAKYIVTGHSLGGALAILFAAVLILHKEEELLDKLEGVYTFGQPRVGDKHFGEFMKNKLRTYDVNYYRFVYGNDLVPRLPYDDKTFWFKHFGPSLFYSSFYKGQVLEEEPNKNYFSLLWVIPNIINAVWELMRSFIIPCINGSDYREGWLMTLLRVIGLAIPGLSAHLPQDYVNLTRLGTLSSSDHLKHN